MATWKKVLVEDANIQVGTVNANLGEATDIGDSNLTVNLVVSSTDGATAGDLTVAEVTFGTAAFDSASSFATSAQGSLADSALQDSDFAAEIITGSAAGQGGIAVTGGTNAIKGADNEDIRLDLDINSIVTTITGVDSSDLIPLQDATDNVTKKATVANIIAAVSSGVTTFNAGRNLTEAQGDTDGTIDLDLDKLLVEVDRVTSTEGSGTDAAGTQLRLRAGAGTGTGAGGGFDVQVAAAGSSGSTLNTYSTAFDIVSTGYATFYEGVMITDSVEAVALDLNNKDIANVGDIDADSISVADAAVGLSIDFSGANTGLSKINIADNLAEALTIEQGGNDYLQVVTTNGSEAVNIGTGVSGTAITIGHGTSEVTIGDNLTVTGDLTVSGVTTTINTDNLTVEDTFISLNSGGSTNVDAGIVFTGLANKVFGWDQSQESGRFGVDYAGGDASATGGGFSPDAWVSTVHTAAGDDTNATAALAQIGNMYINSSNQDIYIYS
tara:strand:+ start:5636 stop:7126 length:1491 start_codon:yes stop_codon:yes gene_type:complete